MADDKKPAPPEKDMFVEIVWTILTILIVLYILNGIFSVFSTGRLSAFWTGYTSDAKTIPMSQVPSLIGTSVVTSSGTSVYAEPGVNKIATEPKGAKGTVLEGPIIKDGVKYWHIKFDDGVSGWVDEDTLQSIETSKEPLSGVSKPQQGDTVSVSKGTTPVFSEPGVNQIVTESKNSTGKIVDGPQLKDGVRYWKIQFDDGTLGWVKEDDLDSVTTKSTPLSEMPSIIGGTAVASRDSTPVYDSPGGKQIGTKNKGDTGTIVEGPIIKDGVKYWHIKFDDGTDGWVKENDLEYVSEPDGLMKFRKFLANFLSFWKYFAIIGSLLMSLGVYVLYKKVSKLRADEVTKYYPENFVISDAVSSIEIYKNPQWEKVLEHASSTQESDWRLSILEADIMLGDLLEKLGLPGDAIGDKLKAVDKSDFLTVDNAWDAHKVRNQIAHGGMSFMLNQHETKRVIELYRSVFEEFKMI